MTTRIAPRTTWPHSPSPEFVSRSWSAVDDDGADDGAEPVPPAAEHAHHDDEQRHGEVEDALGRQVADLQRRDCARERAEEAGDRDREHLVAEGRHAELLGDVLLVADREEPPAEARVLDQEGGDDGERGDGEPEAVDEVLVLARGRPGSRGIGIAIPWPPSTQVLSAAIDARVNVTASVSSAKISPRSEPSRNASAPTAAPRAPAERRRRSGSSGSS